ncbi:MAG: NYN domain-containing protein [Bacteroidota bacterium]
MEGSSIAVYLDFENLAISADTVYPSKRKPLLIEPILDFAASKGVICLKKAYADWSKDIFSQYQTRLMEQGFELVHLPETNSQGKNGSDVRLAIDVMDYLGVYAEVSTFIIGSGDTDFIPLIQRLRARGKKVIVLGFEHSVGKLVKRNSGEFKSLEELIGEPEEESPSSDMVEEIDKNAGRDLIIRFLKSRTDEGPVLMARLKQQLLRLDSSFSEKDLGFSSFKAFINSLQGDLVEKVDTTEDTLPKVYFLEGKIDIPPRKEICSQDQASQFLTKKLKYNPRPKHRFKISKALWLSYQKQAVMSMNEMFDFIQDSVPEKIARTEIKKYINTLFTGGAFKQHEKKASGPLLSRKFELKTTVLNAEELDQIYIQRISEILQSKYPDLEDTSILELLFEN